MSAHRCDERQRRRKWAEDGDEIQIHFEVEEMPVNETMSSCSSTKTTWRTGSRSLDYPVPPLCNCGISTKKLLKGAAEQDFGFRTSGQPRGRIPGLNMVHIRFCVKSAFSCCVVECSINLIRFICLDLFMEVGGGKCVEHCEFLNLR